MKIIDLELKNKLDSEDFGIAEQAISILISLELNLEDIKEILNCNNKLAIADFLSAYEQFYPEMLDFIEDYIQNNMDHTNRMFVSDLISFASDWSLNLNYDKCIELLDKSGGDDDYVMISLIDYVFENFKIQYIDKIYEKFSYILFGDFHFNQTCKIKTAFYLYRITHDEKFLIEIENLIKEGDDFDKDVLRNILAAYYNQNKYFPPYERIINIVST